MAPAASATPRTRTTDPLRIGGTDVAAGTRRLVNLAVTRRLDGSELVVPVHVIRGREPGPSLALVSALHGSQWFPVEVVRRAVESVDVSSLRGTLLAVPVGNPMAFERSTRLTPDDSDLPDLNRVFPGGGPWVAEQTAAVLTKELLPHAENLIDFHSNPWGSITAAVDFIPDLEDAALARKVREMVVAFGYPSIRAMPAAHGLPGPRSIYAYGAATFGIASIAPVLGGSGFAPAFEESVIAAMVQGVRNVMAHLGMIDGAPRLPKKYFHFVDRGHRIVPRNGGLLEPYFGPEALFTEVKAGTVLARVISPHSFEALEELRAPVDGMIFGVARAYPLRPGDWAYFLADTAKAGSQWIDGTGTVADVADRLPALPRG